MGRKCKGEIVVNIFILSSDVNEAFKCDCIVGASKHRKKGLKYVFSWKHKITVLSPDDVIYLDGHGDWHCEYTDKYESENR